MDDRHRQITEGKGLQESRYNQEFIDFLNKWSTPVLVVVLLAALAWAGMRWWKREHAKSHDDAFVQFNEADRAGKPDNLLLVAREVGAYGSVGELATLRAADQLHSSARRGVAPGGNPSNPGDVLNAEQKKESLAKAGELYKRVMESAAKRPELFHHEVSGRAGLIAVLIDQGEMDRARTLINEQISRARALKLQDVASWSEERLKTLDSATAQKPLLLNDQIASYVSSLSNQPAPQPPAGNVINVPPGTQEMVIPLRPPGGEQAPAPSQPEQPTPPPPAEPDAPKPQ